MALQAWNSAYQMDLRIREKILSSFDEPSNRISQNGRTHSSIKISGNKIYNLSTPFVSQTKCKRKKSLSSIFFSSPGLLKTNSESIEKCLRKRVAYPGISNSSGRNSSTVLDSEEDRLSKTSLLITESSSGSFPTKKNSIIAAGSDSETEELQESKLPFNLQIPARYMTIGSVSLAFVICNMDKVNMSVAIIPMANQLSWSASTAGLVQSSLFWGYALSQLPGGWLAKQFSGERVLVAGVLVWSLATAAVPAFAGFLPALLLSRFLVGLGEGVSPPAAMDLIAKTVPKEERSRAVAIVYGGLNVGSVIGLLLAPFCIENLGWESVFYLFGSVGIVWCIMFNNSLNKMVESQSSFLPSPSTALPSPSSANVSLAMTSENKIIDTHASSLPLGDDSMPVPWKKIISTPAVLAMVYAHFCNNWGHYTLLSWLPTYFSDELHLNLSHAALVSMLPPLASVLISSIAAPLADSLIIKKVDTTLVRKMAQCVAFLSPSLCMSIASFYPDLSPWQIAAILTAGLGLSSFTYAGLLSTHQDISPKYASILLGMTSMAGAVPGILGIPLTGYLFDVTHSWTLSLFVPSIFFYVTGTAVWVAFASSQPRNFDE